MYPTSVYYLEAEQFLDLMAALRERGEQEFYISMIESEPEQRVWGTSEKSHWLCRTPTLEEYEKLDLFIENALYSVNGSWGVLISHEHYALLVCDSELWESFQKYYPAWQKDYTEFIDYWKEVESGGVKVSQWLNPFLAHLTKSPQMDDSI